MEQVYKTSHFSLRKKVYEQGIEDLEFIVLDPNEFDLVEEIGFGITKSETWYDIRPYIERLERAKTELEKDEILYELYFVITGMADYFC